MSNTELQQRRKARMEAFLDHYFSKAELVDMLAEAMSLPINEGKHRLADWLETEKNNYLESDFSMPSF
jgi:hypothetical protein